MTTKTKPATSLRECMRTIREAKEQLGKVHDRWTAHFQNDPKSTIARFLKHDPTLSPDIVRLILSKNPRTFTGEELLKVLHSLDLNRN